jgi:hypothetical protein
MGRLRLRSLCPQFRCLRAVLARTELFAEVLSKRIP